MGTYTNPLTDYSPQMELFDTSFSRSFHRRQPPPGTFTEAEEMDLAYEFLDLQDEAEMEQFLGDLINGIGSSLGKIVNSPTGQAIGGVLKNIAKTALPIAGGALGTFVGGPVGGMIGSNLASIAGSVLGLELEGLSPEDQEVEATKQFIRFAGQAVANALQDDTGADPETVARNAAIAAAQLHAPGLVNIAKTGRHHHEMGKWIRDHDRIILFGV